MVGHRLGSEGWDTKTRRLAPALESLAVKLGNTSKVDETEKYVVIC